MNLQELEDIFGSQQLWCEKTEKWIHTKDLMSNQNFFVCGDDGGDKFVKSFDTAEELAKGVQRYYDGHTGCDFETVIYLIVQDGNQKKTSVTLIDA